MALWSCVLKATRTVLRTGGGLPGKGTVGAGLCVHSAPAAYDSMTKIGARHKETICCCQFSFLRGFLLLEARNAKISFPGCSGAGFMPDAGVNPQE